MPASGGEHVHLFEPIAPLGPEQPHIERISIHLLHPFLWAQPVQPARAFVVGIEQPTGTAAAAAAAAVTRPASLPPSLAPACIWHFTQLLFDDGVDGRPQRLKRAAPKDVQIGAEVGDDPDGCGQVDLRDSPEQIVRCYTFFGHHTSREERHSRHGSRHTAPFVLRCRSIAVLRRPCRRRGSRWWWREPLSLVVEVVV